jgi:hypothetical protein
MRYVIKISLLVVLILAPLAFSSSARTRTRKRTCTVNLVGGDFVRGYFVGANSRSVTVEVDGVRKTINLDHVTNILFIVDFKNRKMEERN